MQTLRNLGRRGQYLFNQKSSSYIQSRSASTLSGQHFDELPKQNDISGKSGTTVFWWVAAACAGCLLAFPIIENRKNKMNERRVQAGVTGQYPPDNQGI